MQIYSEKYAYKVNVAYGRINSAAQIGSDLEMQYCRILCNSAVKFSTKKEVFQGKAWKIVPHFIDSIFDATKW